MPGGGIADKLGNQFEGRWVSLQLLTLLNGHLAKAITLEPLVGGEGFEFMLELGNSTEWHQCKTRSTGAWTINRLHSEGVLESFIKKLSSNPKYVCVFVTDQAEHHLAGLSTLAARGDNFADFQSQLRESNERDEDFRKFTELCKIAPDEAYAALKRIRSEVVNTSSLERQLQLLARLQFRTDAVTVLDRLSNLTVEQLTHRLTVDDIRRLLREEAGFKFKDYAFDATLLERIDQAADRFLEPIKGALPPLRVARPEPLSAIKAWYENRHSRIMLLTASAGAGKSQVLFDTVQAFKAEGVPCLPVRLDRYVDVKSVYELGQALLGLDDNPAHILSQAARNKKQPVLILDQLDAVSDISGRRGALKDIILEMVSHMHALAPYKVIAACRSYDLKNDQRYSQLASDDQTQQLEVPSLEWATALAPALKEAGYNVHRMSIATQKLLCIPSNLATFLRLDKSKKNLASIDTPSDLIASLVDQIERELNADRVPWSLYDAAGCLANRMSETQQLIAPKETLVGFPGAIHRLQSAGLIVQDGADIRFAHESYFDHFFAIYFQRSGQNLKTWLLSEEQHLFRRTQVRQILSYMRDGSASRSHYLSAVRELLSGDGVRYHIRDSVARWLSNLHSPTEAEATLIHEILDPVELNRLLRIIYSGKAWFPYLSKRGLVAEWLSSSDEKLKNFGIGLCGTAFTDHPNLAAAELKKYWLAEGKKAEDGVRQAIFFARPEKCIDDIASLTSELIDANPEHYVPSSRMATFGFYGWQEHFAKEAIELIAYALNKIIHTTGVVDPFIGDGMQDNQTSYEIVKLAESAPVQFVESIGPLYLSVVRQLSAAETGEQSLLADRMFTKDFKQEERWGGLLIKSLGLAAKLDSSAPSRFLAHIQSNCHWAELHLALRAIAVGDASAALYFSQMITHPRLFNCDESDEWLPAALAAKAMRGHLAEEDWRKFEQRLYAYRPEAEKALLWYRDAKKEPDEVSPLRYARSYLEEMGLTQWRIAATIGVDAFSSDFRPMYQTLVRKFEGSKSVLKKKSKAEFVRSPISTESAERMSDAAWTKAIAKYDSKAETKFTADGPIGGSYQLAAVLQERVKVEPGRFVRLLDTLTKQPGAHYLSALLDGLRASNADIDTIIHGVHVARRMEEGLCESSLLALIDEKPLIACDEWIFDWLCELVREGEHPTRPSDQPEGRIIDSLNRDDWFENGNRLSVRGFGIDRLNAARTLGRVGYNIEERAEAIKHLLSDRVIQEEDVNVLPGLALAVGSLAEYDRSWCLDTLEALLKRDLRIVAHYRAHRTFNWLLWQDRERFSWLLESMAKSDDDGVRTLSQFWSGHLVFHDTNAWPQSAGIDAASRQVIAALAAGNLASEEYGPASVRTALELASDDDEAVATELLGADWKALFNLGGECIKLAHQLVQSKHFASDSNRMVLFLDDVAEQYPDLALAAARRLILATSGMDQGEKHQERWHYSLSKLVFGVCAGYAERGIDQTPALDLVDFHLEIADQSFESEMRALERR